MDLNDFTMAYTIDDDGVHVECACGDTVIVQNFLSLADAVKAAEAHLTEMHGEDPGHGTNED